MPSGSCVADIGTDHGYLCAYLALRENPPQRLLACDIAEKPLQNAANSLAAYGVSDRVELRLSDGLSGIAEDEADCILLLGMGGTLISRILSACPWIKAAGKRLILQPMSRANEAREWLCGNGFLITQEAVVREGRRLYLLIRAEYTGVAADAFAPGYEYYGELPRLNTPDAKLLLERTAAHLRARERGRRA